MTGGWLTAISGPGNITDNPDQFFPPAGAEWGAFSQDRRRALIGSHPVMVIMCASHRSLLWLGEPRLNLHLIRLLHRGWHSSWWEGLRSGLPPFGQHGGSGCGHRARASVRQGWNPPPSPCRHHPPPRLASFIDLIKHCSDLVVKIKKHNDDFLMLHTCLWSRKAEMTESILEALHCAIVNKSMGDEEKTHQPVIDLARSPTSQCQWQLWSPLRLQSQINTSSVWAIPYLQNLCHRLFFFSPQSPRLCFISPPNQMKIDYLGSCLDGQSTLALCW